MFYTIVASALDTQSGADVDTAFLSDPQITVQNNHALLSQDGYILGAYGIGANITRVKLDSPKLRQVYLPYLRPLERSTNVPNRPNYVDLTGYEIMLRKAEEIRALISNDNGASTDRDTLALWIGDKTRVTPQGQCFTMRCTFTITGVAYSFVSGSLTFDQTLPSGTWSVVGMDVYGTAIALARLIVPAYPWRPGVIAGVDAGKNAGLQFRYGNMGEFCRFNNTALPSVEILVTSAGAVSGEVYLDLVQVA